MARIWMPLPDTDYDDDRGAFVVEDGRYVSARWPGDAYLFTRRFMSKLPESAG